MPEALQLQSNWKLVAFRVDSSAPGNSKQIQQSFGSFPQVRLIVQPVTEENGKLKVHDFAMHLVYNFVLPSPAVGAEQGQMRFLPDSETFRRIVNDTLGLKTKLLAVA